MLVRKSAACDAVLWGQRCGVLLPWMLARSDCGMHNHGSVKMARLTDEQAFEVEERLWQLLFEARRIDARNEEILQEWKYLYHTEYALALDEVGSILVSESNDPPSADALNLMRELIELMYHETGRPTFEEWLTWLRGA